MKLARFRLPYSLLAVTLSLTAACIKSPSAPPDQDPSAIDLKPKTVVLTAIGQWVQIDARVLGQARNEIPDATIHWKSADDSIARVSRSGVVTAAAGGTTQVTATSGEVASSVTVSVEQKTGRIVVTPASATLTNKGETIRLKAATRPW